MNGFVAAARDDHWYALASFSHAISIDVDFTRVPGRLAPAMTDLPASTWTESDVRDDVVKEIASQYRIEYESVAAPDQALDKVRVEAVLPADGRARRLTVHCRTGWRF